MRKIGIVILIVIIVLGLGYMVFGGGKKLVSPLSKEPAIKVMFEQKIKKTMPTNTPAPTSLPTATPKPKPLPTATPKEEPTAAPTAIPTESITTTPTAGVQTPTEGASPTASPTP